MYHTSSSTLTMVDVFDDINVLMLSMLWICMGLCCSVVCFVDMYRTKSVVRHIVHGMIVIFLAYALCDYTVTMLIQRIISKLSPVEKFLITIRI